MEIEFKIYAGIQGLTDLEKNWTELANEKATHFLHFPAWYRAQLEAYTETKLYFLTATDSDGLAAVIPLYITKQTLGPLKLNALTLAYENEMGVSDCLSRIALKPLMGRIIKETNKFGLKYQFIRFSCAVEFGFAYQNLASSENTIIRKSHESKYLDISKGPDVFYDRYNAKFKRNLRRKFKLAQEQGEITFRQCTDDEDLTPAYEQFLKIENSGWKGEQGSSILLQEKKKKYYDILLAEFRKERSVCINLLYLDGKCIATQFGIVKGKTLHLLKIAYDENYANISPGFLILDKVINASTTNGEYERVSFVTGVTWADRWKPEIENVWLILMYKSALHYRLASLAYQCSDWLKSRKRKEVEDGKGTEEKD